MWADVRLVWIGLALGLLGLGAQAQMPVADARVVIVCSDTTAAYSDAAQALLEGLSRAGVSRYDIRQMWASDLTKLIKAGQLPRPRVFVALGTDATAMLAAAAMPTPVLSALIPRTSFDRVLNNSGRKASSLFSALYLDQPLGRQLALIRLALPQAKRLGILWGPESAAREPVLKPLMAVQWTVVDATVDSTTGIFPGLKRVLGDSDVLLAIADTQVYNSNSIQNILLSTFRAGVPMVAFSPAYVRAGALLGLHTTPAQAGTQAANLVQDLLLYDKPLPVSPVESNDFEVTVNEHVARVMNLSLDGRALRLELRRLERLP